LASAAPGDHAYGLAQARLEEGVARFMGAALTRYSGLDRRQPTHIHADVMDDFLAANRAWVQSEQLLRSSAHAVGEDQDATVAQSVYASAMAWRGLLRAYLVSNDQMPPEGVGVIGEFAGVDSARPDSPSCALTLRHEPSPRFPAGGMAALSIGAVVVRFQFDARGHLSDTRVVAAVPDRWFEDAVMRVAPQWRIVPAAGSPPSCVPAMPVIFVPVMFQFR
jgi:TonB family protein